MNNCKTAVLIQSPFQALCSLEAINNHAGDTISFYTIDDKQNTNKIRLLLSDYKYDLTVIPRSSNTLQWLLNNHKRGKYDRIIVGDIFSYPLLLLTLIFSKWESNVIYVDDGNSTLVINHDVLTGRIHGIKGLIVMSLCMLKRIKRHFFTFFPIDRMEEISVVQHSFRNMVSNNIGSVKPAGVYIIGTNTSYENIETKVYQLILKQIFEHYSHIGSIYYCPHRRDINSYDDYCKTIGMHVYDTQISVEYDFIKKKKYPKIIIGFGSTALYTLRKMFPLSEVYNIIIELSDESINDSYKTISSFYRDAGIINCQMNKLMITSWCPGSLI